MTLHRPQGPVALEAVLFDLDGTLIATHRHFIAAILQQAMRPDSTGRTRPLATLTALWAFARVRAHLRRTLARLDRLHERQFELAADRTGLSIDFVRRAVDPVCYIGPFDGLRGCVYAGAQDLLRGLSSRGLKVGILSDFPVPAKLASTPLAEMRWDVLADSEAAGALKPHPAPFAMALEALATPAKATLYVGDRRDTDVAGARSAGMPCVLVSRWPSLGGPEPDAEVGRLGDLAHLLELEVGVR